MQKKKTKLKHANKRVYDGKPGKSSTRVKWRLPFDVVEAIFSTPFMSWHHIVHLLHLHTCGNNIQAHEHTKGGERRVPASSSQPACCHLFFEIQCKLLKRKRKRLRRSRKWGKLNSYYRPCFVWLRPSLWRLFFSLLAKNKHDPNIDFIISELFNQ